MKHRKLKPKTTPKTQKISQKKSPEKQIGRGEKEKGQKAAESPQGKMWRDKWAVVDKFFLFLAVLTQLKTACFMMI